jgi:hypothetical protein
MISENKSRNSDHNHKIEKIRKRLETWRKARKPRARIPDRLWNEAVKAARQYGVNKTARTLHLEYNALKKRLHAVTDDNKTTPAFIELIPAASSPLSECLIELESPQGEKMRIHLKGTALPDLETMGNLFWRNNR